MNKKGQNFMVGIMVLIMAVALFIATIPMFSTLFNTARGRSYLNCPGYVDADATASANETYLSTLDSDKLSCTVIDLGIPYLVLGVLIGAIALLIQGKLGAGPPPEPMYGGY